MRIGTHVWCMAALTAQGAVAQPMTARRVPARVGQAYHARFPGERAVEWKLKGDRNYEAEFKLHGVGVAAKFDPAGRWVETETTILRAALPPAVRTALAREFGGYRIVETQ